MRGNECLPLIIQAQRLTKEHTSVPSSLAGGNIPACRNLFLKIGLSLEEFEIASKVFKNIACMREAIPSTVTM